MHNLLAPQCLVRLATKLLQDLERCLQGLHKVCGGESMSLGIASVDDEDAAVDGQGSSESYEMSG
jgi:hypothetical protein